MSEANSSEDGLPANTARLRLRTGPLAVGVLGRVVSMMLARVECPVDRLDDALLVCETLCAHAPGHLLDGYLSCQVDVHGDRVELELGELRADGARGLVDDAAIPGVGNLLERMADELRLEPDPQGDGERIALVLNFS